VVQSTEALLHLLGAGLLFWHFFSPIQIIPFKTSFIFPF
jgi:hypothetical protein